jgi:DNA repair protein RadC
MTKLSADVEAWPAEALLAALLSRGAATKGGLSLEETAVRLLCDLGGIPGLSRATIDELQEQLGALPAVAATLLGDARRIAAAFELGRRVTRADGSPRSIASSAEVAAWASPRLSALDHEELWLLALDGRSRLRASRCVARGGLHGMGIRVADPLRLALRAAASGFVLVHNHPSGDPTPSAEDVAFTRRVAAAGAVVGLPLLDHVVVAREGFTSVSFDSEATSDASMRSEA